MASEAVKDIRKAEEEAFAIVEKAKASASELIKKARAEAEALIEKRKADAAHSVEALLDKAGKTAGDRTAAEKKKLDVETAAFADLLKDKMNRAASDIIEEIFG